MSEKSWVHRLFFDAYFEDALMRMRSSTGLGSTYSLFTALNEYFYEHGYIEETGYRYHKEKYGLPLVDEFEKQLKMQDQNVRMEIIQKHLEIEQLTKKLTNAFKQWNSIKPQAKAWFIEKAKANSSLLIAQKILELEREGKT